MFTQEFIDSIETVSWEFVLRNKRFVLIGVHHANDYMRNGYWAVYMDSPKNYDEGLKYLKVRKTV